ncbi:MAG: zinc-binding dehydrogenase [Actinophytocola sp.]|nr:zinc-binding dehydrogenase [Actinophytocola sp.]
MKAVTCTATKLEVVERPAPALEKGHLLLNVLRCGICGSDLHARHHADEMADAAAAAGYDGAMRLEQEVVLGHEFVGEVADHGPGTRKSIRAGTPVVAMPVVRTRGAAHPVGLSVAAPGAYAEQVVVQESLTMPVPNGLRPELAALTEPMAVAWHAVRRGQVKKGQVAVVIGCGPIGLGVISMLKASGVRTVIASDFSAGRRALAEACGADVVVDPATESPYASLKDHGYYTKVSTLLELAIDSMAKLRRLPLPWWHVFRAAEALGAMPDGPVVFECVGVPGVIDEIIAAAPLVTRVIVVGVCMAPDQIRPSIAINKEIDLRFVIGYTPKEFRDSLHMLAEGKVDGAPLITGSVGLAGVENAFNALGDPEKHAKIMIDPRSDATQP